MTAAAILQALLMYGPTVIPLAAKLTADIKAGRGNEEVTEADWAELTRLTGLTGAGIYASLGITPPPKA